MKSISIDSEKYVKATDIARELGYTADYVGQLCRAGKVDAQLVGRSWYVTEDSIRSHKKTRYRSTAKASKEIITQSLETKNLDSQKSFAIPVLVQKNSNETRYAGQHFYGRASVVKQPSYFADETALIPEGSSKNKTGRLSVSLADAQAVKITSTSQEFDFTPSQRQEIRFAGSLSVSEVDDELPVPEESTKVSVDVNEVKNGTDVPTDKKPRGNTQDKPNIHEITSKIKVKHLRKNTKKSIKQLPLEHNSEGVLGMRRARISDRNPVGGTLKVSVPSDNASVSGLGAHFILIATLISVLVSSFMLGMEVSLQMEGSSIVTSYSFDINTLLAAVYSAW